MRHCISVKSFARPTYPTLFRTPLFGVEQLPDPPSRFTRHASPSVCDGDIQLRLNAGLLSSSLSEDLYLRSESERFR